MEGSASAEEELERRSKFLHSLIQKKKNTTTPSLVVTHRVVDEDDDDELKKHIVKKKNVIDDIIDEDCLNHVMKIRVRASDMPLSLQNHAFKTARHILSSMPSPKLDSKRLALSLKKEFDSRYGAAWHCIVGKSFGSYVTHSVGGFLYFSIDEKQVYVLLFKTAVQPAPPHPH